MGKKFEDDNLNNLEMALRALYTWNACVLSEQRSCGVGPKMPDSIGESEIRLLSGRPDNKGLTLWHKVLQAITGGVPEGVQRGFRRGPEGVQKGSRGGAWSLTTY
eukprot:5329328-Pyramimonas_sp.AAC.2